MFYCAKLASPIDVNAVGDWTPYKRQDFRVFSFDLDKSLTDGIRRGKLEVKNPGSAGVYDVGKWLLIWEGKADGSAYPICQGVISGPPSRLTGRGGKVTIEIDCRPLDWEQQIIQLYAAEPGQEPLAYPQETGPTLDDYRNFSIKVPAFDARTLQVTLVSSVAFVDVDPGRGPGNFDAGGVTVFDVSNLGVRGFDIVPGEVAVPEMYGRVATSWNQVAVGHTDAMPILMASLFFSSGIVLEGDSSGFATFDYNGFLESLPKAGTSPAAGWTVRVADYVALNSEEQIDCPGSQIAGLLSAGYAPVRQGKVSVPFQVIKPRQGVNVGLVLEYDYQERRDESLTVYSQILLQTAAYSLASVPQDRPVSIFDPTKIADGNDWQPDTGYAVNDRVTYGGVRYFCKTTHVSGDAFDPTKWVILSAITSDASGQPITAWVSGHAYVVGNLVIQSSQLWVCRIANSDAVFSFTKWAVASFNNTYAWQAFTFYQKGIAVSVSGSTYYSNEDHISAANFAADASFWHIGAAEGASLAPGASAFFPTSRGTNAWKHVARRHQSELFRKAKARYSKFSLKWGVDMGDGATTRDIDPGMWAWMKNERMIPMSSGQIVGVVEDANIHIDHKRREIAVRLGHCAGRGMGVGTFDFTPVDSWTWKTPFSPITVEFLSTPGYAIMSASISGFNYAAQRTAVQAAVAAGSSPEDSANGARQAISSMRNQFSWVVRPIVQNGGIKTPYGTMMLEPLACPMNIELAA